MIEIKRTGIAVVIVKENGVRIGESLTVNGGRILMNKSVNPDYIDANDFTISKIKKNPIQAIMTYFPNLSLNQEIRLTNF